MYCYYSVLAMRELTDKADCVIPVENQVYNSFKAHKFSLSKIHFTNVTGPAIINYVSTKNANFVFVLL